MVCILTLDELRRKPRVQKRSVSVPVFVGPPACRTQNFRRDDRDELNTALHMGL